MTESDYDLLTAKAGYVPLADRWFVRLTGSDRQSFFHNFCTADIKKLLPGEITEALVLNTKGKLIGLVHVLAQSEELLVTGQGGSAEGLIEHLDKYLIREKVTLLDVTKELAAVFVCGKLADDHLGFAVSNPLKRNASTEARIGGGAVAVWNVELAGFGYLVVCEQDHLESVQTELIRHEIPACSNDALELVRVENITPRFGVDADESNLPQELGRDDQAISFNKGCYLGQETVARIDARGRVNRHLVQLAFSGGDTPSPGDELIDAGKVIGGITSVAYSFRQSRYIGLGYVRREHVESGTELGNWTVI